MVERWSDNRLDSITVDRIPLVDKMEKILNKKELWSRSYPWNVICTYVGCKAMYCKRCHWSWGQRCNYVSLGTCLKLTHLGSYPKTTTGTDREPSINGNCSIDMKADMLKQNFFSVCYLRMTTFIECFFFCFTTHPNTYTNMHALPLLINSFWNGSHAISLL